MLDLCHVRLVYFTSFVCNDKIPTLKNEVSRFNHSIPNCHFLLLSSIILQILASNWIDCPSLVVTYNFLLYIELFSFFSCHLLIKVIFTQLSPTSIWHHLQANQIGHIIITLYMWVYTLKALLWDWTWISSFFFRVSLAISLSSNSLF